MSVVEFRIVTPDGSVRWVVSRGRVSAGPSGEPSRLMGITADITERKELEERLRQALEDVQRLRDRLQVENIHLREQLRRDDGHHHIVGESEAIVKMLAQAKRVAPTDTAVLITGETGSGKELLAMAIHDMSGRCHRPVVMVNCAALPPALIEGELFGREKGAYTGAMTRQAGRFEVADGSTLILDEIGDLPLDLQGKLLRVLQDGRFERLGSNRTLTADVRVIAATNHDLGAMVREGRFREDLFHRLSVFPIEVPPLRARVSDIPLLVWRFVREFNKKMGKSIDSIPRQAMERLQRYPWPGNVRELRNLVERAMIVSDGHSLTIDLPAGAPGPTSLPATLEEVERKHIRDVLERAHWRISGKQGAAEILGLRPTTLHSRMKKLGISRPRT
jgi:transcriptional regulator with GAF, ATPase, and Fis domain